MIQKRIAQLGWLVYRVPRKFKIFFVVSKKEVIFAGDNSNLLEMKRLDVVDRIRKETCKLGHEVLEQEYYVRQFWRLILLYNGIIKHLKLLIANEREVGK